MSSYTRWPRITKHTTVEELQEIHHRIWDFVLENGHKPFETGYINCCVGCEYSYVLGDAHTCSNCPIKWADGLKCGDESSTYDLYYRAHRRGDLELARQYAKEIRDVEFEI